MKTTNDRNLGTVREREREREYKYEYKDRNKAYLMAFYCCLFLLFSF